MAVDPFTNSYPIFCNNQKLTTFYYPKEKVIDPNFDIKENFKVFYSKGNALIRIQLGKQFFILGAKQIVEGKSIQIYEEVYEDETYRNKTSTLLKEIKLPSSLNVWEEVS